MRYFANPSSLAVVEHMKAGLIGFIDTPRQRNTRPPGVAWIADNGCYSNKWQADHWWSFLTRHADDARHCWFATAPDVVGDADATLRRSTPWLTRIRELGYRVAYVAQDGIENHPPPYDDIDCVFIGGTTQFKLGAQARDVITQAHEHSLITHMGRVNSEKRYRYARTLGCASVDGTYLTFGPDTNLPKLLAWTRNEQQDYLWTLDR